MGHTRGGRRGVGGTVGEGGGGKRRNKGRSRKGEKGADERGRWALESKARHFVIDLWCTFRLYLLQKYQSC